MNKKIVAGLAILITLLGACSGAKTVTHKKWDENLNTVYLRDITVKGDSMNEASSRLRLALENKFDDSLFIVGEEPERTKYQLKYQITQFDEGNRLKRLATFGIDDGSRALLSVKVALIGKEGVLGAWQVQTWVRGGLVGGSADDVFSQAAEQILQHMKGY
jgi:hypothetical protein